MTTFNKLLAVKEGGGNPGAPGSADSLNLAFADFDAAVTSFDLTASNNLLVAFDAASLDFGNAGANPAFNFLGAGDFAVDGDSWFKATGGNTGTPDFQVDGYAKFAGLVELADDLSVGGDLSVAGISTLTGNASVGGDLSVTGTSTLTGDITAQNNLAVMGSAAIAGNLTVNGTLVTRDRESVLVADNFLDMNSGYITPSAPLSSGFTFNYNPIANWSVTAVTSSTITVSGSPSLSTGDFVMLTGLDPALAADEGIYEVDSVAGPVVLIKTSGQKPWCKNTIVATGAMGGSAKLAAINLAVLQSSASGKLEWATGANSSLSFGEVPFDGYSGSQSWTADLALSGDLTIANSGSAHALALGEANADPSVDPAIGKVYTKSMNSMTELFFYGRDTANPVQITKDGELNIGAISFSLQQAYDDGRTILIGANSTPVSINLNGFSGNALEVVGPTNLNGAFDVTGNSNLVGTLDASGIVSFASIGGNATTPDLSVAGFAKIAQGLYVDSTLDVTGAANLTNTLSVSGAATLSSTLDVTGAVLLLSTLNVTDAATLNGAVVVDNTLGVTGAATFYNDITGKGNLLIVDASSNNLFTVASGTGNVSTAGTLNVIGAATLSSTLDVTGVATLSSTLNVTGAATFASTVDVSGLATLESLSVTNGSTLNGAVQVNNTLNATGAVDFDSTLNVDGAASFGQYASFAELAPAPGAPAANTGSVYVSEDPAAAGHAELWYNGDGTANAVMITKNGHLNIEVLDFSLQEAYNDGSAIVTNGTNGAVSITAGAGLTDALDVTGNVDIVGALDASGKVHLTSTGGGVTPGGIPDLWVEGYSQFADVWATATLGVGGAATFNSTLQVNSSSLFQSDVTLAGAGKTFAIQDASYANKFTVDSSTGDVSVAGILDLNGSVDADVSAFDVLSSGGLSLESTSLLSITASASDVVVSASGTIKLKSSYIASNINANATAASIGLNKAVSMTSAGLVAAQANAKDVIVLGVSVETIASSSTAFGKIAEFGVAQAAVEASISIVAGDKLYLSAATAGAVTNVAPTASNTTVFLMGVALTADASGLVTMALRPQFLYSNY